MAASARRGERRGERERGGGRRRERDGGEEVRVGGLLLQGPARPARARRRRAARSCSSSSSSSTDSRRRGRQKSAAEVAFKLARAPSAGVAMQQMMLQQCQQALMMQHLQWMPAAAMAQMPPALGMFPNAQPPQVNSRKKQKKKKRRRAGSEEEAGRRPAPLAAPAADGGPAPESAESSEDLGLTALDRILASAPAAEPAAADDEAAARRAHELPPVAFEEAPAGPPASGSRAPAAGAYVEPLAGAYVELAPGARHARETGAYARPAPKAKAAGPTAGAYAAAAGGEAGQRPTPAPAGGGPPAKLSGEAWEEPRSTSGLRLIGEMAPPSMQWIYAVRDESRRSFVGFLPSPLGQAERLSFFAKALNGTTWVQPMTMTGPLPRKTAWMVTPGCECSYRYGRVDIAPQPYPPWMISLMQWVMPCCGIDQSVEWPNSCNLNLYEDGESSVAWHADDEHLFQGKFRDCRIISLSLGAKRAFELRLNWCDSSKEKAAYRLQLGDGDICTMEGMCQKHLQHRVPREDGVPGARVNLTWRWVVRHTPRCPASRRAAT